MEKNFAVLFLGLYSVVAHSICEIPADLEKPITESQRLACVKDSYFLKAPLLEMTVEKAVAGPVTDEIGFRKEETVFCHYFYRYQNGSSNKFRCYRTNEKNQYMNTKGEVVPLATQIGPENTPTEDQLLDQAGNPILNAKGKAMKADILKVRFQDGSKRNRENYASSAATRFSWIMGFPTENYFSVSKVTCFGCEKDPWQEGRNPQKVYNPNMVTDFNYASIERKNEAKRVLKSFVSEDHKYTNIPWKWDDFTLHFDRISDLQKHEIQVMALFANFFQTVENTGQQHVVLCESEFYDKAKNTCSKTLAATHDMGSSFGNRDKKWIDPQTKNHPRADYLAYADTQFFLPNSCNLVSLPNGLTKVDEAARLEFVKRLDLLTPEIIKAVLANSYFQYADLPFYKQISEKEGITGPALENRILDLWTQLILNKINIFKEARCS